MMWDLTKTTTARVYDADIKYLEEKVPGTNTQERLHNIILYYHNNKGKRRYQKDMEDFLRKVGHITGMKPEEIEADIKKLSDPL